MIIRSQITSSRWVLIIIIFFYLGMIPGCGFHLRGVMDAPGWLDNLAVVIKEAHPDVASILKRQIQAYGKCVYDDPALASYILIIECDNYQEQITNVSASTAPRQYLLTYELKFSLLEAKGQPLLSEKIVSVTRQVTINNNRILGSNAEESLLKDEMRREAVTQLLNQLNRISRTE